MGQAARPSPRCATTSRRSSSAPAACCPATRSPWRCSPSAGPPPPAPTGSAAPGPSSAPRSRPRPSAAANRFTWRRLGGGASAVVALRTDELDGEELADYAASLGVVADQLAAADPLPTPAAALDRLRAGAAARRARRRSPTTAWSASPRRRQRHRRRVEPPRALPPGPRRRAGRAPRPGRAARRRHAVRGRRPQPGAHPLPAPPSRCPPDQRSTSCCATRSGWSGSPAGPARPAHPLAPGFRVPPPPCAAASTAVTVVGVALPHRHAGRRPRRGPRRGRDRRRPPRRHAARGGYLVLTVRPSQQQRAIDAARRARRRPRSDVDALRHRRAPRATPPPSGIKWDEAIVAADADGPDGDRWAALAHRRPRRPRARARRAARRPPSTCCSPTRPARPLRRPRPARRAPRAHHPPTRARPDAAHAVGARPRRGPRRASRHRRQGRPRHDRRRAARAARDRGSRNLHRTPPRRRRPPRDRRRRACSPTAKALVRTLVDDLRALGRRRPRDAAVVDGEYARRRRRAARRWPRPSGPRACTPRWRWRGCSACVFVRFCEDNGLVADPLLAGPGDRRGDRPRSPQPPTCRPTPRTTTATGSREIFAPLPRAARPPATCSATTTRCGCSPRPPTAPAPLVQAFQARRPRHRRARATTSPTRAGTPASSATSTRTSPSTPRRPTRCCRPRSSSRSSSSTARSTRRSPTFGLRDTTLIDPTCGSGHFLLGAFDRLFDRWRDAEPGDRPARARPARARRDRRRRPQPVRGRDRPVPAARRRAARRRRHAPRRRARLPDPRRRRRLAAARRPARPPRRHDRRRRAAAAAAHGYATEDVEQARALLSRQWARRGRQPALHHRQGPGAQHALPRRASRPAPASTRSACRSSSGSSSSPAHDADPERAGYVGQITANSFMKREFGKKLIED